MLQACPLDAHGIYNRHRAEKEVRVGGSIIQSVVDRIADEQQSDNEIEFGNSFVVFRWNMHGNTWAIL